MEKINGSLISMRINGKSVPCEISSSVTITQEAKPATSPSSNGRYRSFIAGAIEWSMSLNGSVTDGVADGDVMTVIGAINSGQTVSLDFATEDFEFLLSGEAIPVNVTVAAQANESTSYSCEFKGTGPITDTKLVWSLDGVAIVSEDGNNLITLGK